MKMIIMNNIQYAIGLRAIADFYEQHADMPQCDITKYTFSKEEFLLAFKILCDCGHVDKNLGNPDDTAEYQNVSVSR